MAVRAKTKPKKAPAKAASSRKKRAASASAKSRTSKKPTVAQLQRERDALAKRLAEAEQRIADLENANDQAINRINWVVDSLQTALDEKH